MIQTQGHPAEPLDQKDTGLGARNADKTEAHRTAIRDTTNRLNDVLIEMDHAIVAAVIYSVPEAVRPLRKAYLALQIAYDEFEKAGINTQHSPPT